MSRLTTAWIKDIEGTLAEYEADLRRKTGMGFADFVISRRSAPISRHPALDTGCSNHCQRSGILDDGLPKATPRCEGEKCSLRSLSFARNDVCGDGVRVAVIPVTVGQGVIGGFANSIAAIIRHAGFNAFVTEATDVNGMYEAYANGADIIFMADDKRYAAFDVNTTRRASCNNNATALGFVTALDAMCPGGISGKNVLVMGCGIIGRLSAAELLKKNAFPIFYDKPTVAEKIHSCISNPNDISSFRYILDATNEGGWLSNDMLHKEVYISAPGVPLSLDENALARHGERLVHDVLHIGTLTMLGELI